MGCCGTGAGARVSCRSGEDVVHAGGDAVGDEYVDGGVAVGNTADPAARVGDADVLMSPCVAAVECTGRAALWGDLEDIAVVSCTSGVEEATGRVVVVAGLPSPCATGGEM
jgi:hypothetical protein